MKSIAAVYRNYGKPTEVVQAEEIEVPALKEGQILVKFLRAAINPSDLGMIGGSYGTLKELPAIAGREGVGEVVEVASEATIKVGERVRLSAELGTWQQYQVLDSAKAMVVPSDIDINTESMAFINPPTALCVLEEFEKLNAGDWIIQNGAGSALGYFMIQICASRGIKTVNMLRNAEAKRAELEKIGANIVVDEKDFDAKKIKEITGGKLLLGLNQIGGESVSNMIKAMGNSATIATIGAMVSDAVRFPTRFLIFNDLRLRGFWWDKYQRTHSKEEVASIFDKIFAMIKNGTLQAPVDSTFKLENVNNALKRASENSRMGKVMLDF
ncbi:MAG: alcohol dehydrogenase [Verrucomicrobiaceae bacterium]|nr:alcohol dehydrogenase [Verrucomicrobiaceae bacterium]